MADYAVTVGDVQAAAELIRPHVHRTPLLSSRQLDEMAGRTVLLKCEQFQRVGAFKFRGACNAVLSLSDSDARCGVVTHSSGNHAQALALAARMRGIPAYIVMPSSAPQVKVDAVRGYGGEVTFCEPTLQAREATAQAVIDRTGAIFIHPYNEPRVMAGQGTIALEVLEQARERGIALDALVGTSSLS